MNFRQLYVTILLGLAVAALISLLGPLIVRTFDLNDPQSGVSGDARCRDASECIAPTGELTSMARDSCAGEGKRVCIAPLGSIESTLVERLIDYYDDAYGLKVQVLTPSPLQEGMVDPDREQIESKSVGLHISRLFPEDNADLDATIIGLMPVDMFIEEIDWRFAFGGLWQDQFSLGVISTFRMDPVTFGESPDDDLYYDRVRKMVSKYIGWLYYNLAESSDDTSPMYDNILSVSDLDRMGDDLPVERSDETTP